MGGARRDAVEGKSAEMPLYKRFENAFQNDLRRLLSSWTSD